MAEHRHHSINYIELPLRDSDATKAFYTSVFGWSFEDYGPDYLAFAGAGVDGGFDRQGSLWRNRQRRACRAVFPRS